MVDERVVRIQVLPLRVQRGRHSLRLNELILFSFCLPRLLLLLPSPFTTAFQSFLIGVAFGGGAKSPLRILAGETDVLKMIADYIGFPRIKVSKKEE